MGIEYKITSTSMSEERFVEYVQGLSYMRTFDPKRRSYALCLPQSQGSPFAYVMWYEGAVYFTDVLVETGIAASLFRGLVELAMFQGGRAVVEEA
jgi:hypothetical protein